MAVPRCWRGMRSAIVPPPSTRGAPPKPVHISIYRGNEIVVRTAHEKSEHDELAHAGCNSSSDGEYDEQEITAMIQR
jgi:hypothetical protein